MLLIMAVPGHNSCVVIQSSVFRRLPLQKDTRACDVTRAVLATSSCQFTNFLSPAATERRYVPTKSMHIMNSLLQLYIPRRELPERQLHWIHETFSRYLHLRGGRTVAGEHMGSYIQLG